MNYTQGGNKVDRRIIIFTGKGGVGKSSVAAAHALKSASDGINTLLVSTDMAHNLGDIFETKLGRQIENVRPCLDLYEIDPQYVMENDFADIMKYLAQILAEKDIIGIEEMGMLPGMEELFSLLRIAQLHKSGTYDRIIVDCAPTGETLSLLKFPELLSWYMEKLFPIGKVGVRVLSPISKQLFKIEMPNRHAMNDIEKMFVKLMELEELLKDRQTTSIRIVTTPEKMVVEETKRNYMYMNLYDFNVDGLYINRILPQDIGNDFFDGWLEIQQRYIAEICETFAALPIYRIPWYDEELKGVDNILRIVNDVLADDDIFGTKIINDREHFEQTDDGYLLRVSMPGADKGDIDLYQAAADIVIKTGNFKRCIPLPNILRDHVVSGAKFEDGVLNIDFAKGDRNDE
ncbi:MAG: ArsA family ATPase [Lachnospiraceae bacterium]|nr:ArsA family ATPase [Lachnospiraceae bacterium]